MKIYFPEEIKWKFNQQVDNVPGLSSARLITNIEEMWVLDTMLFYIAKNSDLVSNCIKKVEYGSDYEFISFEDIDELGLFPPGFLEVMCSAQGIDVDFFMPLSTFFRILLNISEKTYSLRKQIKEDRESCPKDLRKIKDLEDDWYIEMEEAIKSLKKHIEDNKELWEKQIEETRQNKESIMKAYLEVYGY